MLTKTCANVTRTFAPGRGRVGRLAASRPLVGHRNRSFRSSVVMAAGIPDSLPNVDFRVRVRDESIGGDNPFTWATFSSEDYFKGKKVVLFSLPGAFTPTCSTYQLPGFENNAEEFKKLGIDEIYCLSVNDSFVMNKWAQAQDLKSVKVIPDGSLAFTNAMNMNVQKDNHAFGQRSWRYAVVANDMKIEQTFVEPGKCENGSVDDDPYGASSPENILKYLKGEDFDAGA
ncbi:putative peroxiredoxin [Chloropicon primus]|uniref:Glutaredoxin-dependent peroxiredoxin n=1 Tax=Chloropicon primus TaxID=1764295 RepID=A0A5B8MU42_9CHLO|nr:putative peroxiredoxin [Chloropicon primus]UPR03049.1 putative peroxiredoxin [Chloropicon primus]|eukprot:QDZ23836.1 putative peroxiredoxin [Chloropicon primus]